MKRLNFPIAMLACLGPLFSAGVSAQAARSGGGTANAQLLQQMQQLASDRTALQGENEKLKSELADLKKDRDALKAGQQGILRRTQDAAAALAHSNAQREATDQELTQTKAKTQELIARFRETIEKLRAAETEGAGAKQALGGRERELAQCIERNQALYQLNGEVLTRLEREGVFKRLTEAEPFTKIKRVQLENYASESRDKAQDSLAAPPKPPLPAGSATPPPATPPPATPPPTTDTH